MSAGQADQLSTNGWALFRAGNVAGAMREQLAELCVDPITADRDWQALRLGRLP